MRWLIVLILFAGATLPERLITKTVEVQVKTYAHESVKALDQLYDNIVNPIIREFGEIFISDIYRCNRYSQHYKHQAIDFDFDLVDSASNLDLFEFIRDNLIYDQMIVYYRGKNMSHVHVSWTPNKNRCQTLRAYRWKGKVSYKKL